jgi:hypothetical protein
MAMFLFGDRNPQIFGLLGEAEFLAIVRSLVSSEGAAEHLASSEVVAAAVGCGLLSRNGEGLHAGPRLVPIPADAEAGLPTLMRPPLASYVEITGDVAGELEAAYGMTEPSRRFSWPQVRHAVVAGMFLDLAMGNEVYSSGQIQRRPVGDSVVWAFGGISAQNPYGVQWTPGPSRSAFTQLWHRNVDRGEGRFTSAMVACLGELSAGAQQTQRAGELLYLRHLGLVRRIEGRFRVEIPVFGPSDTRLLLPVLVAGARRLVADAIGPALDLLAHHPWWRERFRLDRYRHAAVRLVLEYGIDRVILSKVLAPFPKGGALPAEWGRWVWQEAEKEPFTLMPNVITRGEGPPA